MPPIDGAESDRHELLRVFETQFDYVYRSLRRYGLSAVDAEDLSQEVFLVLWRRRDSYDPRRPLRPWIAGITYRIVQEHRRQRAREVLAEHLDRTDEAPGPDDQVASAHARRMVLQALSGVPAKQRVVLVMHDLDGMAIREVAGALALPLFTTYSQLRAGRRAFAKHVRRAQLLSGVADLRRTDPQALLAEERPLPPAPRQTRARVLRRIKALFPLGGEPFTAAGLDATGEQAAAAGEKTAASGASGSVRPVRGGRPIATAPLRSGSSIGGIGGGLACALALLALVIAVGPPAQRSGAVAAAMVPARAIAAGAPPRTLPRLRAVPKIALSARPVALEPRPGPASLLRGLIGYWRFDEGQGGLARDLSGAGSDCQLRRLHAEAAWGDGALAGSLRLDGHGWLECRPGERLARIEGELTISAWVTRGRALRNYHVLLARQKDTGRLNDLFFGFANGDLAFVSHTLGVKIIKPLPPDLGHWFHVAVTRQLNGTVILFVDGGEVGRASGSPSTLSGGDNPLVIGADINGRAPRPESRFDGAIDEMLLYHRALSASELKILASKNQPPVTP